VFTVRRAEPVEAIPVQAGLGTMRVTTVEQTLVDLIRRPDLGGMPAEAEAAARALLGRADDVKLERLVGGLPEAAAARVRAWIAREGA
jgi:hypothetical protein